MTDFFFSPYPTTGGAPSQGSDLRCTHELNRSNIRYTVLGWESNPCPSISKPLPSLLCHSGSSTTPLLNVTVCSYQPQTLCQPTSVPPPSWQSARRTCLPGVRPQGYVWCPNVWLKALQEPVPSSSSSGLPTGGSEPSPPLLSDSVWFLGWRRAIRLVVGSLSMRAALCVVVVLMYSWWGGCVPELPTPPFWSLYLLSSINFDFNDLFNSISIIIQFPFCSFQSAMSFVLLNHYNYLCLDIICIP